MTIDLTNKTILITGANSGIGKETFRGLSGMGARIIMVCRNQEKAEAARKEIVESIGNDRVDLLIADLSGMRQVRALAEQVRRKYSRLDVLINNAGIYLAKRLLTEDGLETTFTVNHLAPFLLTNLLLELLKASAPSRVVNVSSAGHRFGKLDFKNLQGEEWYNAVRAYGTAKLANIMFTYELARRVKGSGVSANCLHPGGVATNFAMRNGGWLGDLMFLGRPFLRRPEKAAATSIYLAASPEVEGISGQYFRSCHQARSSGISYDEGMAKKLWEISKTLTGLEM